MPGKGDKPVPFVAPQDAGHFVYALTQLPIGTNLLAYGGLATWTEYLEMWTKATGVAAVLEKVSVEEHAKLHPGGFGEEIGEMLGYMVDVGYHGGDISVTFASDVSLRSLRAVHMLTLPSCRSTWSFPSRAWRSTSRRRIGRLCCEDRECTV